MRLSKTAAVLVVPAVCLMLSTGRTMAQEMPSSAVSAGNLAADFYVKPDCTKPVKPRGSPVYNDPQDVGIHNIAIMRYNKQALLFNACMNKFLDNGPHDIEWILFAVNGLIAKAKGAPAPAAPAMPGNMPPGFYPQSDCIVPGEQAGAPPDVRDVKAMAAYNSKVKVHNALTETFNACIKDYSARAKVDVDRINGAMRDAAAQAGTQ